uniref:Uncharacterized protein LOC116945873 isoform X1 n=1 Tax=Petromyzon marinus TaxID=7757 RepID=A0AAJ7TED0_PETMA|nr:uncharacterized protein LOC116945873 isoform X1 [Petromyzon marinus]XP_032816387.1 uncharacterized protein LOC116945873 isoform X1 [Petromyzon marinus]XP_032816388.1 uncharacterized protein LOC116945873 isoform X1 [Petromyzon marinus]XP_032816390.1 uncharacterized protein LOC116945873 isoform X1 [Petromyzon marinus]XP_032816391.1 uncharacterized protein LOC116945873 isoform X1 [Petromyzon marinus]XP_032816392.1 uncharacterized protein LOC116945873 isoform X1 [Petromyzon marinus]XP_03281639
MLRHAAASHDPRHPWSLVGYASFAPSWPGGCGQQQYICPTQLLAFQPPPPLCLAPPSQIAPPSVQPSQASMVPVENGGTVGSTVSSLQVKTGSRLVVPAQKLQFCRFCKEFVTSGVFLGHSLTCHGPTLAEESGLSDPRMSECSLCKAEMHPTMLREHMLQHSLHCQYCLLAFKEHRQMLEHMAKEHPYYGTSGSAILESQAVISARSSAGCLSAHSQTFTNDFQAPENIMPNTLLQPQCTVSNITQPCSGATVQSQPSNPSLPIFTFTLPPVPVSTQDQQSLILKLVPQQSVVASQSQQLGNMPALLTLNLSQAPQSGGVPRFVSIAPSMPAMQSNQQPPAVSSRVTTACAQNVISTVSKAIENNVMSGQEPLRQQADTAAQFHLAMASPTAVNVSEAAQAQFAVNPGTASALHQLQNGMWGSGTTQIMMTHPQQPHVVTVPHMPSGMMPQTVTICNRGTGQPLQLLLQPAPGLAHSSSAQMPVGTTTKGVVNCDGVNPAAIGVTAAATLPAAPMQQYFVTVNNGPAGPITMVPVNQTSTPSAHAAVAAAMPTPTALCCASSSCLVTVPAVPIPGDLGKKPGATAPWCERRESPGASGAVDAAAETSGNALRGFLGQVHALCVFCGATIRGPQQEIAAMVEHHLNTTHGVSQTFDRKKNMVKYYCFHCKVQYHYPLYVNALDAHKKHCPMQVMERKVLGVMAGTKDDCTVNSPEEVRITQYKPKVVDHNGGNAAPRVEIAVRCVKNTPVHNPSFRDTKAKLQQNTTAVIIQKGCTLKKAVHHNRSSGSMHLALDPTDHVDKSYDERKQFLVKYFNERPYPNQKEVALLTEKLWMCHGDAAILFACKQKECLRSIEAHRTHVLLGFSMLEMQGLNHGLFFPVLDSTTWDIPMEKTALPGQSNHTDNTEHTEHAGQSKHVGHTGDAEHPGHSNDMDHVKHAGHSKHTDHVEV